MQLEKIDPKFRLLADQLFFTDRVDLDVSNFQTLLGSGADHYYYLWDRFLRGTEIFWEESFWLNRFEFVLDNLPKKMVQEMESHLLSQFRNISHYFNSKMLYDNRHVQFIAWVKSKSLKKENLSTIQDFLTNAPHIMDTRSLVEMVGHFIPFLFPSMDEYVTILSKKAGVFRNFQVLKDLEALGYKVDKSLVFKMARDLLFKRVPNRSNRRSFFSLLGDSSVMADLKSAYLPIHRPRLVALIKECEFREIEEYHLRNMKSLLELDSTVAEELLFTYADKLYARGYGNKKANVDRLIRACKTFPQFSPKKILAYLSANNRMSDIKHIVSAFPDLKMLVPFL
jgi:hypothetical protein